MSSDSICAPRHHGYRQRSHLHHGYCHLNSHRHDCCLRNCRRHDCCYQKIHQMNYGCYLNMSEKNCLNRYGTNYEKSYGMSMSKDETLLYYCHAMYCFHLDRSAIPMPNVQHYPSDLSKRCGHARHYCP